MEIISRTVTVDTGPGKIILTAFLFQTLALFLLAFGLLEMLTIVQSMALSSYRLNLLAVLKPTGDPVSLSTVTASPTQETPQEDA